MTPTTATGPPREPASTGRLLLALGVAPTAWLLHIAVMPALVPYACDTGRTWVLHATTGALAVVAVLGLRLAHQVRATARSGLGGYAAGRARLWGSWSAVTSWLFLVLIVAEGLPVFVLSPCPA